MSPADNMPDFDKMSPEEIMAWMETLAKRQGAKMEELTTGADVEIAEIDPDTVVIDEPGYVPYGQERPPKPEPSAPPARQPAAPPPPAAASAPPPRQPAAPPPAPAARPVQAPLPEPQQPAAAQPTQQPLSEPERPAAALPSVEVPVLPQLDASEDEFDTKVTASGAADAMAWLESLAADQSDDLFNIDLSALSEELGGAATAPAASQVNPVDWLESLTETQGEAPAPVETPKAEESPWQAPAPQAEPEAPAEAEVADPFAAGVDPMAWLEELARRQGAKSDELVTNTRMNIPVPKDAVIKEPGYKPFSPDAPFKSSKPAREPEPEPLQLENPTDWLSSLADSQGFDEGAIGQKEAPAAQAPEEMSLEDIERAIAAGTVSPEQMQYYLEHQTDRYIETMEGEPDEIEEEAPPVPAEIPDWLLEQVGAPPAAPQAAPESALPPLIDEIQQPPDVLDMPDWLKEDTTADSGLDFNIFEEETPEPEPAPPTPAFENITLNYTVEVDPNDPWVEAFDQEHELGRADINNVPDWYTKNLADPERIAAVEAIARGEEEASTEELADVALPEETELPAGELEAIPDWLLESAPEIAAEPTPAADIPDWLREMEVAVEPDVIPDWLMEPLGEEDSVIFEPEPEPAPPVMQQPPTPAPAPVKQTVPPPPAPKPAPAPVNLSATLENARALAKSGSVNESLAEYESLIRANRELQFVVDDLTSLVKVEKSNPAVYRVLGDGLMRQGKLQAALDVYREALNQL